MNSVLLTPNPKSRSTGESDSGKVCIIHKHGRANYGTIQTLTIKRWEKIQEIKDIRSNAENEREQQTLICERIPPVVDFAQHGYHHFCYNSFINTRNIWTLSKQMEAKIEAFEMWSYRRIMRISWKEMKGNAEVLKMIGLKNAELSRKGNWPIMDMYEGIITYKN